MTQEKPKKRRTRKAKGTQVPSVQISSETESVKTVARPVPQLKKKLHPHELIQTLEDVLTRLDNLESQVKSLSSK